MRQQHHEQTYETQKIRTVLQCAKGGVVGEVCRTNDDRKRQRQKMNHAVSDQRQGNVRHRIIYLTRT